MDKLRSTWSTNPGSFMRFGNTCVYCGRDPMEYPFYHIYLCLLIYFVTDVTIVQSTKNVLKSTVLKYICT